ncbi:MULTISPECIES: hypothetical protein [unclassified Pseudomonas]|uniref:hypothetical protein n=1 Tax=unclassified Pseudomonas TaxID=196821 RepID=UPI00244C9089|nr:MULTISPECIES: hypothetical protein [unclassified Pseudomonas]MDG9925997.1 hypothetical protein [Pseudomonas sp. GD04045]MDH0033617.1 hypothetical protein [Pseudomonas sp. GD04019]
MIELRFESTLPITPENAWRWITEVRGLRQEMRPWLWMSVPRHIHNLRDVAVEPGRPLFTSWLWLFGVLPLGVSRLTLLSLTPNQGFVEQSPMTGMRLWRHERSLAPVAGGVRLVDQLTVDPLLPAPLVRLFLHLLFNSRHRTLRRRATR